MEDELDAGSYQPAKRLTEEELQKSVDRLSRSNRPVVELQPLAPRRVISQEALEKHIHHLYDASLARRQQERDEVARQMEATVRKDATMTTSTIKRADEEALVQHLYDDTLALRKSNFDTLYKQETSHYKRGTRKLTKSEQEATADRLYREGMEKGRAKNIALYEKYVAARQQPPLHRTAAEIAASADKMTKGEGANS